MRNMEIGCVKWIDEENKMNGSVIFVLIKKNILNDPKWKLLIIKVKND